MILISHSFLSECTATGVPRNTHEIKTQYEYEYGCKNHGCLVTLRYCNISIRFDKANVWSEQYSTLVYQINVPGCLFFFEKNFQPGCLIRYTPFIKFMEIFPDRMPISYTPFIIFDRFFRSPHIFFSKIFKSRN